MKPIKLILVDSEANSYNQSLKFGQLMKIWLLGLLVLQNGS
jgi:hypothetical protein